MRGALVVTLVLLVPLAVALPTPGLNGAATQATLGRIFPEALQTNDFIGYDEAVTGLGMLDEQAPDRVTLVPLGLSRGWLNPATGDRASTELYAVEITNEKSPVPLEDKLTLVFFLSIHGNEKGAREGGLRAIEDLALGIGLAAEEDDLLPMLDYQRLVFIFANTDGWTHEEPLNTLTNPQTVAALGAGYTRENAAGVDLNRQFPTVGYLFEDYTPLSEPEPQGMLAYLQTLPNVVAGADMHGMMQNTNLVRLLLKDGEKGQQQLFENERLAELYKERLNGNAHYDVWNTLPAQPGTCCGQVAEWAATFDAIGYSASGTAGAFIVQRQGLDAPGYTVEFAYNHATFDNQYEGPGAIFNDLHVEATRDIVAVFMRFAAEKVNLSVETEGARTAVLATPYVATNADDDASGYSGWFTENEMDDAYDIAHRPFTATPQAYWDDLKAYVRAGEAPGILDVYEDAATFVAKAPSYENVVVPGSAVLRFGADPTLAAGLRSYVEAGGNLVLTDRALEMVAAMGLVPADAIGNKSAYSGYTDLVDRDHPLTSGLKGFPRQTYDPNPLGFSPGTSPVWWIDREAWEGAGGVTLGGVGKDGSGEASVEDPADCGDGAPISPLRVLRPTHEANLEGREHLLGPLNEPRVAERALLFERGVDCAELDATNVGVLALGQGTVHVFGAILPDPTEESNHPYGLDNHALATNGNLLLLGMLGMEYVFSTPPAIDEYGFSAVLAGEPSAAAPESASPEAPAQTPGLGVVALVALAAVAALATRRRA